MMPPGLEITIETHCNRDIFEHNFTVKAGLKLQDSEIFDENPKHSMKGH